MAKEEERRGVSNMVRVRYIGPTLPLELPSGKSYDVLSTERGWYRIKDDTDEDFLYPPLLFELVDVASENVLRSKQKRVLMAERPYAK